ncbi:MAG: hypothetical protein JWP25_8562 [Bradyrhizobium sp.]|jgi:hypothetical protein|nr:hypothetical protein [Bradyrhizobium sp.]
MASDDADVPPNPADENNPSRLCEKCNAVMKQLGEFPSLSIHAATRIFRCYVCDHVVSEQA